MPHSLEAPGVRVSGRLDQQVVAAGPGGRPGVHGDEPSPPPAASRKRSSLMGEKRRGRLRRARRPHGRFPDLRMPSADRSSASCRTPCAAVSLPHWRREANGLALDRCDSHIRPSCTSVSRSPGWSARDGSGGIIFLLPPRGEDSRCTALAQTTSSIPNRPLRCTRPAPCEAKNPCW